MNVTHNLASRPLIRSMVARWHAYPYAPLSPSNRETYLIRLQLSSDF